MTRVSVCRHVDFEAAHMLEGYQGGCGSVHGHSYALELEISCPQYVRSNNPFNFVMDFKNLDSIIKNNVPDHMFMYNVQNDKPGTVEGQIVEILRKNNLRLWPFKDTPSAENMVVELAENFQKVFDHQYPDLQIVVEELRLWETKNSHAIWRRSQNENS